MLTRPAYSLLFAAFFLLQGCEVIRGPVTTADASTSDGAIDVDLGDGAPPGPVNEPPERIAGMVLAHIDDDEDADASDDGARGYGTELADQALARLGEIGTNAISLSSFALLDTRCDTNVRPEFDALGQENEASLLRMAEQAHARSISVLLSPTLWINDGTWRGELGRCDDGTRWTDSEWRAFFESYAAYVVRAARIAQEASIEILSLGLELKTMVQQHPEYFRELAALVRSVYSGRLTYSANWDGLDQLSFGDALDYVGVNAFYPLTGDSEASAETLRAGAERVATELAEISRANGRPILFTEVGYKSCPDSTIEPWLWPEDPTSSCRGRVDEEHQAIAYRAIFESFWDQEWFAGMFWWKTFTDLQDRDQERFPPQEPPFGYDPLGKSAETVLREYYGAL